MTAMHAGGVLHLSKHHGAGNDFLVVLDPDDRRPLSAAEARALCDRHRGIGADGVIRVVRVADAGPGAGTGPSAGAPGPVLSMDLRNADGGVAEMSGNGIRCMVQAAVDAGLVAPGPVQVLTLGGPRTVDYEAGPGAGEGRARVGMGPAVLGPELATDRPGVRWARQVDMGNPHVVLFGTPVGDDVVAAVGPRLEQSVAGGANVEFVWPGPRPGELTMRVWERGVGETLACGTGACAAAAAAHRHGEVGPRVRVHSPGGVLDVDVGGDEVALAGPTQKVGDVTVDAEALARLVAALHAPSRRVAGTPAAPADAATEVAARP
ncbi:MAG TPA: diaminopimelate epimerase [Acidimicrobiales bacterium]|nr:diaminopimelate epimerase [Acidimicrobiales bacterium]